MNRIAWLGFGILVFAIGIQLFPLAHTNPPVTGDVPASPVERDVLHRACYDCHSNETVWPWYAWVAPVSWLVVDDVEHGRRHVNFSQWADYPADKQVKILKKIWEEVSEGEMPPGTYLLMHPKAKLSTDDKAILRQWSARR